MNWTVVLALAGASGVYISWVHVSPMLSAQAASRGTSVWTSVGSLVSLPLAGAGNIPRMGFRVAS
ncbi:hypothetical protein K474DRAFT_1655188 [Panus rudis PR-1116 ss-1]|nr:hypothetical protein K474DRAFT_1655188 [Panus rudis PR-1116 ss-1]